MIKLFRIDHRLLHGQVAFAWSNALGANAILIANDSVANDEIRMATMRLAKPAGVKLVIKNIEDSAEAINKGATDKYNLFILVEYVKDADRLSSKVPSITSVNLGGARKVAGTTELGIAFHVIDEEKEILKKMMERGIEVEVRQVPDDRKEIITKKQL